MGFSFWEDVTYTGNVRVASVRRMNAPAKRSGTCHFSEGPLADARARSMERK
jgi:hypothetical protein